MRYHEDNIGDDWEPVRSTYSHLHKSGDAVIWQGADGMWRGFYKCDDYEAEHGPFHTSNNVIQSMRARHKLRSLITDARSASSRKVVSR